MNYKKTTFILFVLLSTLNPVFSQSEQKYEIFLCEFPIPLSEKTLIDTIILYEDSTFKYSGYYYSLGFHSEYSEGTYSITDTCILLNSFQKYNRDFNVIERRKLRKGTKYKQKRGNYANYHYPEIYEFSDLTQKIGDTLLFPIYKFEVDSYNNAIGFILYDRDEYVGEYQFKFNNNRKIILEIGPKNYNYRYFKDEKFIIKENTIVREKYGLVYRKQ